MCKLSNKIKFCTCIDEDKDIEELNHYWVLHRYNKNKGETVMGSPILPDHLNPMFEINAELLVNTLNTPEAFDKNLQLEKGDRLEVVLCNNAKDRNESLYYNFKYTKGIWKTMESDCFDLMSNFDEVRGGEVKETK
ncbi:hypothetical protein [Bizionia myxarmorum]|uniref:Uncharacterized protein n=1 Tax=Bizionia myxarmorum TaxID=291186 RepID=A0A5D0R044_9FLAO|nr:hypothetical protein [Bizionia myxarmorum]TYB74058.1 hypothetical protein ES674_15010 [Bizionia myxarmorum]